MRCFFVHLYSRRSASQRDQVFTLTVLTDVSLLQLKISRLNMDYILNGGGVVLKCSVETVLCCYTVQWFTDPPKPSGWYRKYIEKEQ